MQLGLRGIERERQTTRVSKSEAVRGGGDITGTGHGSFRWQLELVKSHVGWSHQPSDVNKLELSKLGEKESSGRHGGHCPHEHRLRHGSGQRWEGSKHAEVHHSEFRIHAELAIAMSESTGDQTVPHNIHVAHASRVG